MTETRAVVINASVKRVVASGDDCSIVLNVSESDWHRFTSERLHKSGPLKLAITTQQQKLDFESPDAGHANGNGHKPRGPKGSGGCFYDEASQCYRCKDHPITTLGDPCQHYKNPADAGDVVTVIDAEVVIGPSCGLRDGIWYCADLPDVRLDSACRHMMLEAPKRTWSGRRRINGVLVEGLNPCPNPECGRKGPKEGESHECRAPRSVTTDEGVSV